MSRWAIAAGVLLTAGSVVLIGRMLYPPAPTQNIEIVQPPAEPTPEPFEPPEPEDDDLELPTLVKIPVCCCSTAYGACVDVQMVRQAARLHAVMHDHDLIGCGCASADEEDHALWRVLRRPEQVEVNGRNRLAMADRAAHRERVGPS